MAESKEEWELSKENIQPIQQGRKADILKILKPLTAHPEELILRQRQAFEQELRTYSGDDALAVWCRYIRWVEQNFPKGGKDGHIKELIKQCLSILIKETKYKDDCRFIEIWLKFANMSTNPMEVYEYMYSHNIGCKSATFFISWAWKLEQLGNYKKANEILIEGIHRKAQPFEKIKTSHLEFETRLAGIVMNGLEQNNSKMESGRSAFSMLKPQKKKPPISRTGESVIEANRTTLTLGRQQPQSRSSVSSTKVPFQIYNSENIAPSLPVQADNVMPFILHSGNKENERKAGKWNKVKVKQQGSHEMCASESDLGFKFHCDDIPQPSTMPRAVPKTSKILTARHRSASPPMALFEPPDPMKRPMYNKIKVYGGAEEYSLEEIRAAAWFEKNKQMKMLADQQKMLMEHAKKEQQMEKIIQSLTQQVEYLTKIQSTMPSTCNNALEAGIIGEESQDIASSITNHKPEVKQPSKCTRSDEIPAIKISGNTDKCSVDSCKKQNLSNGPLINTACVTATESISTAKIDHISQNYNVDSLLGKYTESKSYREAANMVQDLYNGTLTHPAEEIFNSDAFECRDFKMPFGLNQNADGKSLNALPDPVLSDSNSINHEHIKSKECEANLPFTFFHDATDVLPLPSKSTTTQEFSNESPVQDALLSIPKSVCCSDKNSSKEDIENIPPEGYVQEMKKRELAGILEPSKSILFVPLEQQKEMEDDLDPEDIISKPLSSLPHEDKTLVLPSSTEQFATAAFLASTPCSDKNQNLKHFMPKETSIEPSNCIQHKKDPQDSCFSVPPKIKCQSVINKNEITKSVKDQSPPPEMQNGQLSVIMEASRESYSKTSSSSSSSSSVSLTKSSHLDHYQQSVTRRHHSTVVFKEVNSLGSVPEYPNSDGIYLKENAFPQRDNEVCSDEAVKSFEIFCTDLDPFDEQLIEQFMESLNEKVYNISKMQHTMKSIKSIKLGENVKIGDKTYIIESFVAEGSYSKVFQAQDRYCDTLDSNYSNRKTAFKVCTSTNPWELYICEELHRRLLKKNDLPNISKSIMSITSSVKYADGIVLLSDYSQYGTLLQLINFYKSQNLYMPELIAMYFSLELLYIVSKMHECNVIHSDIKPDNILIAGNGLDSEVRKNISYETTCLCLIDFGRAIDLSLFKKGICFKTKLNTEFQCIEMKENKPWVYQLDWYGVLSCIHVMLFSEYMTVRKNKDDKWEIGKKFKRYSCTSLWIPLFNDLLNIPACYQEPNLKPYIDLIQSKLEQNYTNFTCQMNRLTALYRKRKN